MLGNEIKQRSEAFDLGIVGHGLASENVRDVHLVVGNVGA
jgi:hypothetical protein